MTNNKENQLVQSNEIREFLSIIVNDLIGARVQHKKTGDDTAKQTHNYQIDNSNASLPLTDALKLMAETIENNKVDFCLGEQAKIIAICQQLTRNCDLVKFTAFLLSEINKIEVLLKQIKTQAPAAWIDIIKPIRDTLIRSTHKTIQSRAKRNPYEIENKLGYKSPICNISPRRRPLGH